MSDYDVAMKRPPILIFQHLAKTAGMTLNQIFIRKFDSERVLPSGFRDRVSACGMSWPLDLANYLNSLDTPKRDMLEFVGGHFGYGVHALLPRTGQYLTLFRDPVDRALSNFYYNRRTGTYSDIAADLSLSQYLQRPAPHLWFCNAMLRSVSGNPELDPFGVQHIENMDNVRPIELGDVLSAVTRLRCEYSLVGICEKFDEFLVLMALELEWPLYHCVYKSENINDLRTPIERENPDNLEKVRRLNRYDQILYQKATEIFDEKWLEKGDVADVSLKLFHLLNAAYQDDMLTGNNLVAMEGDLRRNFGLHPID
jgi:hypothetical protein